MGVPRNGNLGSVPQMANVLPTISMIGEVTTSEYSLRFRHVYLPCSFLERPQYEVVLRIFKSRRIGLKVFSVFACPCYLTRQWIFLEKMGA